MVSPHILLIWSIQDIELVKWGWEPTTNGVGTENLTLLYYYLTVLHIIFGRIKLVILSIKIRLRIIILEVFHLHPVTHLTIMTKILPVGLAILHPNCLIVEIRSTVQGDTTTCHAYPVQRIVVTSIVAGDILTRACGTMRVTYHAIAPMHEHSTHHIIGSEVLVVRVHDWHDGFLIRRVADIGSTMQVPYHIASNLPCLLITRGLPCTERLCHQFQTMVVNQVCGHRLCLGILTVDKIHLGKQMPTCLIVHLPHIRHLRLIRNMLHSKLQIILQHLEDGRLTGRLVVLLRNREQLGNQRDVTKL